jgi:hypothetical protein
MKKDKIEKFIFENRDNFDHLKAPDHLWNNIEQRLNIPKHNSKGARIISFNILNVAAVSIGLLIAGVLIGRFYFSKTTLSLDPNMSASIEKAENFYGTMIDYKLTEVKQNNLLDAKLTEQLTELDKEYEEIKERMIQENNINNDLLLNQMIKNYKLRLALIELLLEKGETKKINNYNFNIKDTI